MEVTSDTEGAVVAIQQELEQAGCRVSIHPPNTDSAEVDVKIKQLKNGVRAITVLPFLLPIALAMYAVGFACSKINMVPSSTAAHNYSPMEMFLGRSISLARDLGARRGGKPLTFGSRVEVYEGTSNSMADRTRPAIWLGAKGNSYGSGLFYLLDTERVVARDQWKALPMDVGTIERINSIARLGKVLHKRVPVFFRGVEVPDEPAAEAGDTGAPGSRQRLVVDSGQSIPGVPGAREAPEGERWTPRDLNIVRADELPAGVGAGSDQLVQLEPEQEPVPPNVPPIAGADGDGGGDGGVGDNPLGLETPSVTSAVRDIPAVTGGPRRSGRERRAPARFDDAYQAMWDGSLNEELFKDRRSTSHLPVARDVVRSPRVRSRPSHKFLSFEARRRKHEAANSECACVLSAKTAIATFGQGAVDSMVKELKGIHSKGVFTQVCEQDLSREQRKSVIRSSMFLKEKYLSTGDFEKLKARFVAGGHLQDRSLYTAEETSSPTVSLSALYMVASIAAREGRHVSTMVAVGRFPVYPYALMH